MIIQYNCSLCQVYRWHLKPRQHQVSVSTFSAAEKLSSPHCGALQCSIFSKPPVDFSNMTSMAWLVQLTCFQFSHSERCEKSEKVAMFIATTSSEVRCRLWSFCPRRTQLACSGQHSPAMSEVLWLDIEVVQRISKFEVSWRWWLIISSLYKPGFFKTSVCIPHVQYWYRRAHMYKKSKKHIWRIFCRGTWYIIQVGAS